MTTHDLILLRFDPDSDWREANWVVCDADGAVGSERRDALETIVAECAGRPIIGLLPGAAVLATRAALPRASRNKRLQALPYALEDQLAADPETLHFALGRERDDGSCEVEIVARELLESVLARCRSADLTLAALHADAACIAPKPGDLQVWIDGDDMHVRHPDGRRQTLPAADLLAAVRLTGIETQTDGVLGVRVYGDGLEAPAALTTLDVAGGVKYSPLDTGALAWLGRQRTLAAPVDLLQGEFARPSGWSAVDWTRWRTTAAAAGQLAHATPAALPIGAVLGAAMAAGKSNTEIQQVLSEAEQLVATLRDVHASTARPTSTDLAIAFQNKENAGVVGLLRRRLATTAAEDCEPASKAQRF